MERGDNMDPVARGTLPLDMETCICIAGELSEQLRRMGRFALALCLFKPVASGSGIISVI